MNVSVYRILPSPWCAVVSNETAGAEKGPPSAPVKRSEAGSGGGGAAGLLLDAAWLDRLDSLVARSQPRLSEAHGPSVHRVTSRP